MHFISDFAACFEPNRIENDERMSDSPMQTQKVIQEILRNHLKHDLTEADRGKLPSISLVPSRADADLRLPPASSTAVLVNQRTRSLSFAAVPLTLDLSNSCPRQSVSPATLPRLDGTLDRQHSRSSSRVPLSMGLSVPQSPKSKIRQRSISVIVPQFSLLPQERRRSRICFQSSRRRNVRRSQIWSLRSIHPQRTWVRTPRRLCGHPDRRSHWDAGWEEDYSNGGQRGANRTSYS